MQKIQKNIYKIMLNNIQYEVFKATGNNNTLMITPANVKWINIPIINNHPNNCNNINIYNIY